MTTNPVPSAAPLVALPRRRTRGKRSPGRFAATTKVPVDRSRAEIERLVRKHKATAFASGSNEQRIMIGFEVGNRQVRWSVPLPPKTRFKREAAYDQEVRRLWRALCYAIKGRLIVIESGVEMFDQAFLSYIVTAKGLTVGDVIVPQLGGPSLPALESPTPPALPAESPEDA